MDEQALALAFYGSALLLILVVWRDRIERNGLMLLKRTDEGVGAISAFGERNARALQLAGNLSVAAGLVIMVLVSWLLVYDAYAIFASPSESPSATVGLVVPGIHVPGSPFYLPLVEGVIAIATVMVLHEFAHGVLAAAHGVRPKSLWLFLFLIFPGAGVELDETNVMRKGLRARMHIYSAGPFANVVCALLAMALINLALAPAYEGLTVPVGIEVTGTTPGLPAAQAGVPNGTLVRGLNGAAVTDYASFNGALRRVGPNETVVLETDRGRFEVTTAAHPEDPSRGYLGVVIDPGGRREVREEWAGAAGDAVRWAIGASTRVLYYVFMLHISIGVINLLPVFPLDGGRMLIDLVGEWGSPSAAAAAKLLSSALLFVLILNIIGPHTVSLAARLLG